MPARLDPVSTKRVDVLKALAHPSRLLIAEALMRGELCVGDIRDLVGDDVSTVSKHLAVLKAAGVVLSQKRGLNVYYQITCDCFGEFLKCIDQVCTPSATARTRTIHCC